ncbi:dihydropteroate synthase [Nakamurella leprariae]|uniref:Dihydropteroate synthase n=1 Tax=Nakamurella leprariae TaxID=2803911 RepID=A0A938YB23_9ACTN|nr:dihydropteroate synthase [Nakamurella leprariae]
MGVLNVTPDSFSDGGRFLTRDAAVARGLRMAERGADLIDVGGESTRPGAPRVPETEELDRVLPVIGALAAAGVRCSVDTTRAAVAVRAVQAGAVVINDVSGGLADPEMASAVADLGVPWILMHWRGHSSTMQALARYDDVVDDVRAELSARVEAALAAGVRADRLILDPGLGFAKTAEHNWQLLAALEEFTGGPDGTRAGGGLGFPVLVGASRKRFLGALLAGPQGPRPPAGREAATAAVTVLAAMAGAWGVRVHEIGDSLDAIAVVGATRTAARTEPAPRRVVPRAEREVS